MKISSLCLTIILGLGLGVVAPEKGTGETKKNAVSAFVCDHRYGAQTTWSQGTDTSQLGSFWWAEACAFRENLTLTVFDNPFSVGRNYVPVAERRAAARTGRLGFQLYFTTDRWANPKTGRLEIIPDWFPSTSKRARCFTWESLLGGGSRCLPGPCRLPNRRS